MSNKGPGHLLTFLLPFTLAAPIFAGFPSTETFLPAVGRIPGKSGAQFYTTIWATNLTGATVHFTFDFLAQNQANTSPASFADTLAPGQTKVYENVVETRLGLNNALGAARVTSDGEILVSERIYNQEPGDDLGNTEGLFFAGVPKGFSISLGQSASIQGINQGGAENFRYNFALVETGGASATVHVVLYDDEGHSVGSKDYILQAYEQIQPNVDDLKANVATTNARITATVTAGTGSVLLAGAQLANESQDSSGFEMSFRDDLLGGGGGGLSAVSHDATLVGNGTSGTPLGINPASVVTSIDGLHGAVTLSAGSNVTITPTGQTLTIAASGGGGGGGLTLPYSNSIASSQTAFVVFNTGGGGALEGNVSASGAIGVYGNSVLGSGVYGTSGSGYGVTGSSGTGGGVQGTSGVSNFPGVNGVNNTDGDGVFGLSSTGTGVRGSGGSGSGAIGVLGSSGDGTGVVGTSTKGVGVDGVSANSHGVVGVSEATGVGGSAIWADSETTGGIALFATNNGSDATVVATNASNGVIYKGFSNGGTEVFEVNGSGVELPTIGSTANTTAPVCIDLVNGHLLFLCNSSSREFKKDIESMREASTALFQLHPVTFHYKDDAPDSAVLHYGLVAEEVEKVYPDLVMRDRGGRVSGVRYEELSSMLLNELQKEHARTVALERRLAALETRIPLPGVENVSSDRSGK